MKVPFLKSIGAKITGIAFFLPTLLLVVFIFGFSIFQRYLGQKAVVSEMDATKIVLDTLEERDSMILSSTLEVLIQDSEIKRLYLQKDREVLYEHVEPLFKQLKKEYGITHFYFIAPNGETFLRVHNKDIYGDLIERDTFKNAEKTREVAVGLELGKTAYALRSVMPYYDKGELIGYIELGEEIGHFLGVFKNETNNEYALVVDKNYLNKDDWQSVRKVAGLEDNWDDFKEYVVVSETSNFDSTANCFSEDKFNEAVGNDGVLILAYNGIHGLSCGGFEIVDAGDNQSGGLVGQIDVSEELDIINRGGNHAMLLATSLIGLTLLVSLYISLNLRKSISKLSAAAQEIAKGNLDQRIKSNADDEMGILVKNFNQMATDLSKNQKKINSLNEVLKILNKILRHDILNDLTVVGGNIDLYLQYGKEKVDVDETMKTASEAIKRDIAFISQMKELEEAVAGGKELKPFKVQAVVQKALEQFEEMEIEVEGEAVVLADQAIESVMVNLFRNALVHGGASKVKVRILKNGNKVVVRVEDNGKGISDEIKPRLFKEGAKFGDTGHSGLGLYIISKTMERYGGKVSVEDNDSSGAVFVLRF